MTNRKKYPIRTSQHMINDKGIALFHYLTADLFAVSSILNNDYGIDEILDTLGLGFGLKKNQRFLTGKLFGVQVKSRLTSRKKEYIKHSTASYLYENTVPTFIISVDIKKQRYLFANVRQQIRENYDKYTLEEGKSFPFYLSNNSLYHDRAFSIESLKKLYPNSEKNLIEVQADNFSLYFDFEYEYNRPKLEKIILELIYNIKENIEMLTKNTEMSENIICDYHSEENKKAYDIRMKTDKLFYYLKYNSTFTIVDYTNNFGFYSLSYLPNKKTKYTEKDRFKHFLNVLLNYRVAFNLIKELIQKELSYWQKKHPLISNIIKNNFEDFINIKYKKEINLDKPPFENINLLEHMKREEERVGKLMDKINE